MLERVRQALLDDAIGGQVDRAREREGLAVDVQPHGQAGAADLLEQGVEPVEPGLRRQLEALAVVAHRAEQPAHLGERRAAGLLDAAERLAVLLQRLGKVVPDGADLQHHHADRVGHDVVELARDARALLGDGDARRDLALALGARGALLGGLGLRGALAQGDSRRARRSRTATGRKMKSPGA